MENKFIPQAIDIVKDAIAADNAQDYERAYALYQRSLEHFMTGLKYERNPQSQKIILGRVQGYMTRAEQLKELLDRQREAAAQPQAPVAAPQPAGASESKEDAETSKLRGALASAVVSEKPNVSWDDVAGLEMAKDSLKEAVILPAKFPQLFVGKRRPWRGILLYGPPGTGKSYLAKAVATEADATFFSVSSSDLVSKWQGESERLVRNLFEMAREAERAIVFIDEIDSLCSNRSEGESDSTRRIKTEFLVQMQGVGNGADDKVLVLGATNVPWELDPAMRRRFEKRIYIPLPEAPARSRMFVISTGDTPNVLTHEDFEQLGVMTDGCSGSDINVVTREALMEPLRKCQSAKHFRPTQDGFLEPCEEYPPCPHCHAKLSTCAADCEPCRSPCQRCGAQRMSLYDVPSDRLRVPQVEMADFLKVLQHSSSSVAAGELDRFVEWTAEFGQEG